ncbi:metallophosphoesterase [uncultured Maribacter sp.]|uniref:metallophosphoesterase n=1 Tax=uncultured Maribacter sp. TaxID=431308 RepID=UPI002619876F|nr:metallophosphoesterase [uncultured Maribacter sp.]
MLRLIIFTILYVGLGAYVLQGVKTITKNPWLVYIYVGLSLLVLCNLFYQFTIVDTGRALTRNKTYAFTFFVMLLVFNLVAVIFLFSEDIIRFFIATYTKFYGETKSFAMPDRRKFLSKLALGMAAIPFGALLYGMYKGKYNFKVLKYDLEYDDLPDAFDGYQITQISDVHSGSFDDRKKIEYAIDLINKQKSDVLLFTGDMVNNKAEEMYPWKDLFATLEAKDGKFSVLGNHDYGDYVNWPSKEAKEKNLKNLKDVQKEMGFDLLLNDSRYLVKGSDQIALVGVENWGKGGFKKAGDLSKAASKIKREDFKILMSHDPSHWEQKVVDDPYHYHLTLSGHTHGMQFGIEIPGWFKWSPVKWRYKYWAGIYKEMGQFINVNRGFGFLGYPGRVGIWPEITVITLKKKSLT